MKQIFAMLRLDAHLMIRDKILWYVLFFPAVTAVILLLVSGLISGGAPCVAVCVDIPKQTARSLERMAELDYQPDREALFRRVGAFDHVAGVYWEDDTAHIVYQGNEGEDYQNRMTALISGAFNQELPEVRQINLNPSAGVWYRIIVAALFLSPVLTGGTVSGFLIVAEKEHKLLRCYQTAPVRFSAYIGAKSLLASMIGLAGTVILCAVFGMTDRIGGMALVMLCSLPLFGAVTALLGFLAEDKVSCVAVFKALVIVFLVLPLASAFVPRRFQAIFYILPTYWQFQAVLSILGGAWRFWYGMITLLSGVLLLILLLFVFKHKTEKI